MSQDSKDIQDRLTKRGELMVQEEFMKMDLFTLENSRITITQKEGGMSCKKMALSQSLK